jgi:hypothetical protein
MNEMEALRPVIEAEKEINMLGMLRLRRKSKRRD